MATVAIEIAKCGNKQNRNAKSAEGVGEGRLERVTTALALS